jgi:hypothetical protein
MKTIFSIFLLFSMVFASQQAEATAARTIYNITDTGTYLFIVKSLTTTPTILTTFEIDKAGLMVNTANSVLYVKDVNGIIYPINIGADGCTSCDSVIIDGAAPHGASSIAKTKAAAAKVRSMKLRIYKDYRSAVTTVAAIKAGAGVFHTISIDSVGVGGKGTVTIWDASSVSDTASTNTPLFSGTITAVGYRVKDVYFTKGLVIKQKTTTAGRVHVSYFLVEPVENDLGYNQPYRYQSSLK